MVISITEVRKIMGVANKKYTDKQLEEVINLFTLMADLAIDSFIAKSKKKEKNGQA